MSAHYDHLGDDPGGLRFPGSIDNASGVAVVLEIARQLANEPDLPFNILFAFLTGEEAGLRGARHLIAESSGSCHNGRRKMILSIYTKSR